MRKIGKAHDLCPINYDAQRTVIITDQGEFTYLNQKRIYPVSWWFVGNKFSLISVGVSLVLRVGEYKK